MIHYINMQIMYSLHTKRIHYLFYRVQSFFIIIEVRSMVSSHQQFSTDSFVAVVAIYLEVYFLQIENYSM